MFIAGSQTVAKPSSNNIYHCLPEQANLMDTSMSRIGAPLRGQYMTVIHVFANISHVRAYTYTDLRVFVYQTQLR